MSALYTENDEALNMVLKALRGADIDCARFRISMIDTDFAREIEALIRAYEVRDAIERIERYLAPKYPSVTACASHVGSPNHFSQLDRSLL
jgi:hypothetical protein